MTRARLERQALLWLYFTPLMATGIRGWLAARQGPGSAAEDVLADHRPLFELHVRYSGPLSCTCGYVTSGRGGSRQSDFEAHQAAALAAAGVLR